MAVGTILCAPEAATMPDGSAGNLGPALARVQGTEANPKKHFFVLDFDGAGAKEVCWWSLDPFPNDYASGGIVRISWFANSVVAGNVVWSAAIACVSTGDADTVLEHAAAAATDAAPTGIITAEANRRNFTAITLANLDALTALDSVDLIVFRDSANASDTATVDARLKGVHFEYTSA